MRNRITSLLLTLVMLLSLLPTTAFAAAYDSVEVNNIILKDGYYLETNGATAAKKGANTAPTTYVAWYKNGVLTLKDYNGKGIETQGVAAGELTVKLSRTNSINNGSLVSDNGGDITVTSDSSGTLSISKTTSGSNPAIGIETGLSGSYQTGNVTIKGNAKVTINMTHNGTGGSEKAYGIYAKKNITISESASVDITCATPYNTARFGDYCNGLHADKNVTIDTNGTIKINVKSAGEDGACSYGIYPMGTATLTKVGNMEVQWKKDGSDGGAFFRGGSFDTSTHAVNVDTTNCYASYRFGTPRNVTVQDGQLTGPGVKYANGSGYFLAGDKVNITPATKKGRSGEEIPFKEWTSSDVMLDKSATTASNSFTVPGKDVTVTAKHSPFVGTPTFTPTGTTGTEGTLTFKTVVKADAAYEGFRLVKEGNENNESSYNLINPDTTSTSSPYEYSYKTSIYDLNEGNYYVAEYLNNNYYLSEKFTVSYTVPVTTYTVSFDANGGTGTMADVTGVSGSYPLPACTFTAPSDKQFKGWATSASGTVITDASITVSADTRLYAIWEPIPPTTYSLTTQVNGGHGTISASKTGLAAGSTETVIFTPDAGYEIDTVTVNGVATGVLSNVLDVTMDADKTVVVTYKAIEYNITVTDGKATIGAGSGISKAAQGTTVTLTANAAPDGKVFDKWEVVSGGITLADANSATTTFTMPAEAVSVKATYKDAPHTHTFDQETVKDEALKSAADCTNDAVYYKSCACGEISTTETFTAADTALGHDWATDWSKDADNHWKECSRCHEKKDNAAHDYGEDNICDTCGHDKTVPHTHNLTLVPAKAPTCTEKGNTAYYTCDGCDKWFEDATGASEITDKTSVILAATGHSASDWKSDNTDHWKECTVVGCGVIIEGSKAAHTAGEWIIDTPATATTSGTKHKECTVCGYTMATETIPATGGGEHTHSYGSDWKNDADNHWHECSCGDKTDKAAHSFKWVVDKEATATKKGSKHEECKVCGYKKAAVEIPATGSTTKPSDPTQTNPSTGAESPKTGDNSNMILWIALLFVSGGAVIGITVYSKKKKENAE